MVPILSGPLRGARWVFGAGTHGCWAGTYERRTQKLFRRLIRPGDVVWDVGANVGFLTLLAARLVGPKGRVIAFEPLPRNVELLRRHVTLNRSQHIEVLSSALGNRAGVEGFDTGEDHFSGGLSARGALRVPVEIADRLVESGRVPPPAFVKIDVEGGEGRVLDGFRATLRATLPAIVLSAHGWQQRAACRQVLTSLRYDVELVRDGASDGDYQLVATASRHAPIAQ